MKKQERILYRPHPWHGISPGEKSPEIVTCYIEIVPTDTVKYEVDKQTGYLKVDRPQKFSNVCPTLYGFIPQTLCAQRVGEFCMEKTGRTGIYGDGDPMDVCVFSERSILHGDLILRALPIGGLRMIDGNQADDKILAVLIADPSYGEWQNIGDCPQPMLERLKHYFLTYKDPPGAAKRIAEITHVYDREEALEVIRRSCEDYVSEFPA